MDNKLTTNFSLSEFIYSNIAVRKKIDNTPNDDVKENLSHLTKNLLQPLRDRYGKPLTINSGYRCPQLNKAVGGVPSSQHLTGEAADVSCSDPRLLLTILKNSRLTFDQAILYSTFLHLSLKRIGVNRRQVIVKLLLLALTFNVGCAKPIYLQGKTEYIERVAIKDTTIYIELGKQVAAAITTDSSQLENQTAISFAAIDSLGNLHHTLEQKELQLKKVIQYREKTVIKRDSIPYPQIIKEVKEVSKIPKLFWITFWIAVTTVGIAIFKILRKFH